MITVTNKTRYSDRFLRTVLSRALKHWQKEMKPLPNYLHNIRVTIVRAKQDRGVSGLAWTNTNLMRLKIPYYSTERHPRAWNGLNFTHDLIYVFYHELMHNIGHRSHREINDSYLMRCACEYGINLPWEYISDKQPAVASRPKRNLKEERYYKALKMVTKWEKKATVANKHLKKWQKKVKRYEKILSNSEEKKFKKDK